MIVNIFCYVDDFCKEFNKILLNECIKTEQSKRGPKNNMLLSEVMTIIIYFHYSGYRNFKSYYLNCIEGPLRPCFNALVSYNRFLELKQESVIPMGLFCKLLNSNACTGVSFVDSFSLPVCHIKRERSNKVFEGLAKKGKTTMGWFFGFKLHFVINHKGEILNFFLTPGNVHDCNEQVMHKLTKDLFGKLFGDKGYIGKELFEKLFCKGIQLVTKIRKNMKNILMKLEDKVLLRKRGTIESVIGVLKDVFYIQHTRHRNPINFTVNLLSGLVAYALKPKKPTIYSRTALLSNC